VANLRAAIPARHRRKPPKPPLGDPQVEGGDDPGKKMPATRPPCDKAKKFFPPARPPPRGPPFFFFSTTCFALWVFFLFCYIAENPQTHPDKARGRFGRNRAVGNSRPTPQPFAPSKKAPLQNGNGSGQKSYNQARAPSNPSLEKTALFLLTQPGGPWKPPVWLFQAAPRQFGPTPGPPPLGVPPPHRLDLCPSSFVFFFNLKF